LNVTRQKMKRAKPAADDRKPAATSPLSPPRRRRIKLALAMLLACLASAALVQRIYHRRAEPLLPSLQMEGLDPMVAAAIEEAESAVRDSPNSARAWGGLGQVLYVHGLDRQAATCFARAEPLASEDPRWPYLHGRAIQRENGDAALPYLRKAAALCRGEPAAPGLTLVELLLERGEFAGAEAQLNVVLQRRPDDPPARALLDRARLQIARGHWDKARGDLEAAAKASPDVKAPHVLLASAYARAGDAAAAAREALLARALPDDSHWPDPFLKEMSALAIGRSALLERAEMLLARGNGKQAIVALEAAAKQYPADAEVWMILGDAYRGDGQLSQAEANFRRAVGVRPDSSAAQLRLGAVLCAQGRFADALPALKEAVRLNPNLPETHYQLGACLMGLGDRAAAIEAYREAVRVEPSYRPAYVALAKVQKEAGQTAEAEALRKRAMELGPDD
jgi:tetratricopeptide (TPR) repeat protein